MIDDIEIPQFENPIQNQSYVHEFLVFHMEEFFLYRFTY